MIRLLACLILLLAPLPAQAASAAFDRAWSDVAQAWRTDLKDEGVVGGALWFARDGKVLKREAYGLADRASERAVDEATIFHWASITKVFTGVAILQLRDRGLVSLDDPAVKYLPELRAIHDPFGPVDQITLRHLLTHSSGLRSATFPWGGDEPWHPHEPPSWDQVAAMWPYTEIEFAPGSRFSYSNPGLSILGRIVEVVTREPYEAYVDKNILRPLGMRRSYFDQNPPYLAAHRSNHYRRARDGALSAYGLELDTGATVANGGLNAPLGDMMRFADFLLGVGDTANHEIVLKRASLEEMFTPTLSVDPNPPNVARIGLTFFVVDHAAAGGGTERFLGHAGHQLGFHSFLQVNPRTKSAMVVVANTVRAGGNTWNVRLRDGFYDRLMPTLSSPRSR